MSDELVVEYVVLNILVAAGLILSLCVLMRVLYRRGQLRPQERVDACRHKIARRDEDETNGAISSLRGRSQEDLEKKYKKRGFHVVSTQRDQRPPEA